MAPLRRHHTLPAQLPPVPQLYQPQQAQHGQHPLPLAPPPPQQQHQRFFHFKQEPVEQQQHGQQAQHAAVAGAGATASQAQGMPCSAFFSAAVGAGVAAAASPVYHQTAQNLDSIMEDLGLLVSTAWDGFHTLRSVWW